MVDPVAAFGNESKVIFVIRTVVASLVPVSQESDPKTKSSCEFQKTLFN